MKRLIVLILLMMCFVGINAYAEDAQENELNELSIEQNDLANSWRYEDGKLSEQAIDQGISFFRSMPSHSQATRRGIDVSAWQGTIDWEKVKASGIDFAIIRCGYGMNKSDQDDSQFLRNVTECERLGIPYGVYIYSYATNTTKASSEADHVLRLIKGHKLSYPVYFDMEDNSTLGCDHASIAKTFCNKITSAGYSVGVYANLNWWNNYLTDSCFSNWHRWVAQYYSTCQYKNEYAMWQYTSSGRVNGISGNVDMNYLIGYPEDHGTYTTSVTEGTYNISSKENEALCLDVKDSSIMNTAAIEVTNTNNNSSNQRFEIISVGKNQYKILAEHSGKALDVKNSNASSGAELQQYEWNSKNAQIWEFVNAGDGYYYIKSKLGTYLKLDTSNGNIVTTDTFNISDSQKWKLTPSDYHPIPNGIYNIVTKSNENQTVGISGSSISDKANVCVASLQNNNLSQQYSITYAGKGYYKIIAEHSNKSWDVANGSKNTGANLQQYVSNNSNAQLWKFVDAGDGYYYLKSKLGTTVSVASDKTNVNMAVMNFGDKQKWKLNKVELEKIEDGIYSIRNSSNSNFSLRQVNNNIQINKYDSLLEQKFKIEYVGNGYYKIIDITTGYVFDVENGSKNINTNLQTHEWNGTDAQLWRFIKTGNNKYILKSKVGTFIDILSNKASDNINVNLYSYSNSAKQNWTIKNEKITFVSESGSISDENVNRLFGNKTLLRYGGNDRYKTAFLVADAIKKSLGKNKFDSIIVAYGGNYPDALTGSYLANVKKAPILLVNKSNESTVKAYIAKNLNKKGVVYLLGGTGVISEQFEKNIKRDFSVKRLGGKNRYDTNLEILNEAGVTNGDVMVCSGNGFADSLSASSLGKPIILADKKLTDKQKSYLNKCNVNNIYLIGGSGAVNATVESECRNYGTVLRIAGNSRYTTSVAVALGLFGDFSENIVLACGSNFPDGLAGGVLANSTGAPVILTDDNGYTAAKNYVKINHIIKGVILGGNGVLPDKVINKIMN